MLSPCKGFHLNLFITFKAVLVVFQLIMEFMNVKGDYELFTVSVLLVGSYAI